MTGLSTYFEGKIGQKIMRRIVIEKHGERIYTADILYTDPGLATATIHVRSYDLCLSETSARNHRDLGDLRISNLLEFFGLDDFWLNVLLGLGGEDAELSNDLTAGRPGR